MALLGPKTELFIIIIIIIQVASPIPRGALKKKRKCEGALRDGLLQVGLQSFLQKGLAPNETPSPEVTSKGTPKPSE